MSSKNYTEEQILEKVKIILKDLKGEYYSDSCINNIYFNPEKQVSRPERKSIPAWTVSVKSIFNNTDFLTISDETGQPLYYQNFNYRIIEIAKDNDGQYYRKI
jgi:hypothetical protein